MDIIISIMAGGAVGLAASTIVRQGEAKGMLLDFFMGSIGALLGSFFFSTRGDYIEAFLWAILGAISFVFLVEYLKYDVQGGSLKHG